MQLSAVILAGGDSRRMDRDKAWVEYGGKSLVERAVEKARQLGIEEIFISGRAVDDYSGLNCPVLLDPEPDLGPLSGIERGLHHCRSPLLLVLAADLPHMDLDVLRELISRAHRLTGVVPQLRGRLEPLAAVYPKRCHAFAFELYTRGRREARSFAEDCLREHAAKLWRVPPAQSPSFANWNQPAEGKRGEMLRPGATGAAPAVPVTPDTAFARPRNSFGNRYVYAVISQRAGGLSIGVNLTPDKRCNSHCAYCEVDRDQPGTPGLMDLAVLSAELGAMLDRVRHHSLGELDWFRGLPDGLFELKEVALSGDGEPTLSSQFDKVLEVVLYLRAKRAHAFKVVVITNATGLRRRRVRRALQLLASQDEIWVKLDAGTQGYMNRVNAPGITMDRVLRNILDVSRRRPVVVQSLFPCLKGSGPSEQETEAYARRLLELTQGGAHIQLVQIYSAHRPPHLPDCSHLPLRDLSRIARRVREVSGLRAEVF